YELERLHSDFTPDTTFGADGVADLPQPPGGYRYLLDSNDGTILILRTPEDGAGPSILRLRSDGTLDPTFRVAIADVIGGMTVAWGQLGCFAAGIDAENRLVLAARYDSFGVGILLVRLQL